MIKRLLVLLVPILFLAVPTMHVSATDIIETNPEQVIVKETDLGKTFTITLKNKTDKKIVLQASEILFSKGENGVIAPTDLQVTDKALEMFTSQITLNPGAEFEHKVRVKFLTQNYTDTYPGLKYANQEVEDLTYNYTSYVPFLIQNTNGEYTMGMDISISNSDISTTAEIEIRGSVRNDGGKFFNATGTVSIYKGNALLHEQEITEQLAGIIFPGDNKDFEVNYKITDNSVNAIGEYRIEAQVKSDINTSNKIAAINFMYIPQDVIKTGLSITGAILGLVLLIVLIWKFHNRKRIQESY